MRRLTFPLTVLIVASSFQLLNAEILVELRSAEDPSLFGAPPDCRVEDPRSCRGLLPVDSAEMPPLRGVYTAFRIENVGADDYADVWVTLAGFGDEDPPGNLVRPAKSEAENPGDPSDQWYGAYRIGALAAGENATAYFYLDVTDPTSFVLGGVETRPDVTVWEGLPYSGTVVPASSTMPTCSSTTNRACLLPSGAVEWPFVGAETLPANTNRVLDVRQPVDTPVVGTQVEITVVGESGLLARANDYDADGDSEALIAVTPTGLVSWPSGSMRLIDVAVTISGEEACGLSDCTCTTDPPAQGECAFVRQDGGPPACELRAIPATAVPTCIVLESSDSMQIVLEESVRTDYVARYEFRVRRPGPEELVVPLQYIRSGAQLKHTDLSLDDCLAPGSVLDPAGGVAGP